MKNLTRNNFIFAILLYCLVFLCNYSVFVNALDNQTAQENASLKTNFFDADGSFYLDKDINLDGNKLHGFVISDGVSYYNNGKLDFNNPIIKEPKAYFSIFAKNHKQQEYHCIEQIISSQKLYLKAEQTLIGDVSIEGKFLDERGQFWNYSLDGKNVAQAQVSIIRKCKTVYSATHFFKYWSGD